MNINQNIEKENILNQNKKLLENHLFYKVNNNIWLGRLFADMTSITPPLNIAQHFPYYIQSTSCKTEILDQNLAPILINNPVPNPQQIYPVYIISMPCTPDFNGPTPGARIQNIINAIETDSFGTTPEVSLQSVAERTALVMGLNTFYSIDSAHNHQFKEYVASLSASVQSRFLATRIVPFFWSPWKYKQEPKGFPEKYPTSLIPKNLTMYYRSLLPVDKCYMIAKSVFNTTMIQAIDSHLNITKFFGPTRLSPVKSIIPYQEIRNKILYAPELHQISALFYKLCPKEPQYILSLDSDFASLKTSTWGLLSYYDAMVDRALRVNKPLPSVMSSGYSAPDNEQYILIKLGIELDREIRNIIARTLPSSIYMPEPNFAFNIANPDFIKLFSWTGGKAMTTESRRLIKNGINSKLINPEEVVFLNQGGIQTEIDKEWHTNTIKKYTTFTKSLVTQKNVLEALRGLHQSYCDPQIWSTNIYQALNRKVSSHMKNAISPMKKIRGIFDPYDLMINLTEIDGRFSKTVFDKSLRMMEYYPRLMFNTFEDQNRLITNADEFAKLSCLHRGMDQMSLLELFKAKASLLFEGVLALRNSGYTENEIKKIVTMSFDTGYVIKNFLISKSQ